MLLGVPVGDLAWLAAAIVVGGIFTGLLAGLFGVGGGGIIVPVLYEVFRALDVPEEVRMQLCVGSSLAVIVPTSIRAYLTHKAKGTVLDGVLRGLAVPAVAGVALGGVVAAFAPGAVMKLAFAIVAVVVAVKLLAGRDDWRIGAHPPGRRLMALYGALTGLSAAMMGTAGGATTNLFLSLHGVPIHNAVAVAAGLGVWISIAGTIGYALAGLAHQALLPPLSIGFVSLVAVALMAPVTSYTAPIGARLAHRMTKRRLEIAFGVFLILVSVRFIAGLVW